MGSGTSGTWTRQGTLCQGLMAGTTVAKGHGHPKKDRGNRSEHLGLNICQPHSCSYPSPTAHTSFLGEFRRHLSHAAS